ncbi:hypothetical protein [Melittangium boletus]|nr:hypothetical protein [Melittangium boletus]
MDPLAELRESLLEPETATAAPPPLPPRRTTSVPAVRAASGTSPAFRPAMSLPSVRIPIKPSDFPEAPGRPVGAADPFAEPAEPRLPAGASSEETIAHLRALLKQKADTLTRARTLYEDRDSELRASRIAETTLRGQLVEAQGQLVSLKVLSAQKEQSSAALTRESARTAASEAQVARLEDELRRVEEDRKDLSRALAEVEAELARLNDELVNERDSRGAIAEELIGAKEALSLAQDRVSELVTEHVETQGALESVRDEYQATLAELEHTAEQLQTALRERELIAAERAGLSARVAQLEAALSETEWSHSSLEEVQARSRELEEERGDLSARLEDAETEMVRLRDRMDSDTAALTEVAEAAESNVARLEEELRAATADRQDLSRALAEVEAELGTLRAQVAQRDSEAEDGAALEVEELHADGRVREAEELAERMRQRVKMLEGALEVSRSKGVATEAEAAARQALQRRVAELEQELAEERARAAETPAPEQAPLAASPDEELLAERDQLRADVATMKRKLMAAELALETAASHKMKVTRLEAQLAQLQRAK